MFKKRDSGYRVTWEIKIHGISLLPCDGELSYVQWKRGRKKDRRGMTKRVLVSNGSAVWEETFMVHGTVTGSKKFEPKDLRLRIFRAKNKKSDKRLGGLELDLAKYVKLSESKQVIASQATQEFPILIGEKKKYQEGTIQLTIKAMPPSANVSPHAFDDDSNSCNTASRMSNDDTDADLDSFCTRSCASSSPNNNGKHLAPGQWIRHARSETLDSVGSTGPLRASDQLLHKSELSVGSDKDLHQPNSHHDPPTPSNRQSLPPSTAKGPSSMSPSPGMVSPHPVSPVGGGIPPPMAQAGMPPPTLAVTGPSRAPSKSYPNSTSTPVTPLDTQRLASVETSPEKTSKEVMVSPKRLPAYQGQLGRENTGYSDDSTMTPTSSRPEASPRVQNSSNGWEGEIKNESNLNPLEKELIQKDKLIQKLEEQVRRQKLENDHRILVEAAITLMTPTFVNDIPLSSILLYKSLHHWKAFTLPLEESSNPFRKICNSCLAMIGKHKTEWDILCYWLSTSFMLFQILNTEHPLPTLGNEERNPVNEETCEKRKQLLEKIEMPRMEKRTSPSTRSRRGSTNDPVSGFQHDLNMVAFAAYKHLVSNAMSKLHTPFLLACIFHPHPVEPFNISGAMDDVLAILNECVDVFRGSKIPADLTSQFVTQIFLNINANIIEAMMESPKLCCVSFVMQLKMSLGVLELWAATQNDLDLTLAKTKLAPSKQAATMLMVSNKNQLLETELRKDICPSLSDSVVACLLENYTPDHLDTVGFPYTQVRALKYREQSGRSHDHTSNETHTPTLWCTLTPSFKEWWTPKAILMPNAIPKDLRDVAAFSFLFD